jgi:hypothetical protein
VSEVEEPKLTEVRINVSAGGKIHIEDFGKIQSDWGVNLSRVYSIPEDWSNEDAEIFQLEQEKELRAQADAVDQREFDIRYGQSYLNPDREID